MRLGEIRDLRAGRVTAWSVARVLLIKCLNNMSRVHSFQKPSMSYEPYGPKVNLVIGSLFCLHILLCGEA